jgi:flagellin
MRINSSEADFYGFVQQIREKQQARIDEQMATGKRVNRASDDAAAMAVAETLRTTLKGHQTATENLYAGMSALNIGEGASSSISDMMQRQRELALQSQNSTLNQDQRQSLNREYQSLSQEIERVAQGTQYNGQGLLNGQSQLSNGQGRLQAGGGPDDGLDIPATRLTSQDLGMDQTDISTESGARDAMQGLDQAMRRVLNSRAEKGALINRMESQIQNHEVQAREHAKSLSQVEDMDFAVGLTEKVRLSILQEGQNAALSQFNQLSRSHLVALLHGS